MASTFRNIVLLFLTPKCYDQYFVHFNFLHGECLKATISKALGFVIILGSISVKIPQILKIMKSKSGEGISLTASLFELSAITSISLYSYIQEFPFSSWGDGFFLAIQTATVIALILHYKKQSHQMLFFMVFYSGLVALTVMKMIPLSVLMFAQILNLPIVMLAKGVQALANYRNQSTGQLSGMTLWMQFLGCLARIFTSLQETGDTLMVLTYVLATLLNGIIVFQLHYYAKSSAKTGKKGKAKRN